MTEENKDIQSAPDATGSEGPQAPAADVSSSDGIVDLNGEVKPTAQAPLSSEEIEKLKTDADANADAEKAPENPPAKAIVDADGPTYLTYRLSNDEIAALSDLSGPGSLMIRIPEQKTLIIKWG